MAGCFGNSAYDRSVERQLYEYLDSLDREPDLIECNNCHKSFDEDDIVRNEEMNIDVCEACDILIKTAEE